MNGYDPHLVRAQLGLRVPLHDSRVISLPLITDVDFPPINRTETLSFFCLVSLTGWRRHTPDVHARLLFPTTSKPGKRCRVLAPGYLKQETEIVCLCQPISWFGWRSITILPTVQCFLHAWVMEIFGIFQPVPYVDFSPVLSHFVVWSFVEIAPCQCMSSKNDCSCHLQAQIDSITMKRSLTEKWNLFLLPFAGAGLFVIVFNRVSFWHLVVVAGYFPIVFTISTPPSPDYSR